jgi:hypothetical protein
MFNWLRRLIAPKVRVVEVDMTRPRLDPDARKSLADLKSHPGLNYIVARFRLQRWYLENEMRNRGFDDMRQFDQVQLGARWIAWCERQVEEMLNADTVKPQTPQPEDIETFIKAQAGLELVGQGQ